MTSSGRQCFFLRQERVAAAAFLHRHRRWQNRLILCLLSPRYATTQLIDHVCVLQR